MVDVGSPQARHVGLPSVALLLAQLAAQFPAVPPERLEPLLAFSEAVANMVQAGSEVPGPRPWPFPEGAAAAVCVALERFPSESLPRLLHRVYPHALLPQDTARACEGALAALGLAGGGACVYLPEAFEASTLVFAPGGGVSPPGGWPAKVRAEVCTGRGEPSLATPSPIVDLPTQRTILAEASSRAALCFSQFRGWDSEGLEAEMRLFLLRWDSP